MEKGENREHERRFLVSDISVLDGLSGNEIEQGYLFSLNGWKGRARRWQIPANGGDGSEATPLFTLKGPKRGMTSPEYEFELELSHAMELIEASPHKIIKTRYQIVSEGGIWEIDVFHGANEGLVIAEVEASREVLGALKRPWWCGKEITQDERYNNENLASQPFNEWSGESQD